MVALLRQLFPKIMQVIQHELKHAFLINYWVALMEYGKVGSCNSNGCVAGAGSARALINFRIKEIY